MKPETFKLLSRVLNSSGGETCWWNNPELNDAIDQAVEAGWVYRKSTTQAHWTSEGVAEYGRRSRIAPRRHPGVWGFLFTAQRVSFRGSNTPR